MKITIISNDNWYWYYNIDELKYTQKEFDCAFKNLYFFKLHKYHHILFNNGETEKWFKETYISDNWLNTIYYQSLEGYEWLKDNFGKGIFKIAIQYPDKQELKTIVNKIVNVELIRGK